MSSSFVELVWRQRRVRVEYAWIDPATPCLATPPLVVFLHEGLGSLAMWKDFPQRFCHALGVRGLVYSRPGYGRSTPRAPADHWAPDFMHQQAQEVLPALLGALGVETTRQAPWLLGHSDGGSIALIHAATRPRETAGLIVLAPHIMVEPISVESIARVRQTYQQDNELKKRLAAYHDDPDSAFYGWNDAWLSPAFRNWSIEALLGDIACPTLAIQGRDDEYGTLDQIKGIAQRVLHAQWLELAACGHSPHRDQAQAVIQAAAPLFQSS